MPVFQLRCLPSLNSPVWACSSPLAIKLDLTTRQLKSMTAAYPTVTSDLGSML